MRRQYVDDDTRGFASCDDCHTQTGAHLTGCPSDPLGSEYTPNEADRMRAEYEQALDDARHAIAVRADLERRAATEPEAAQEMVRLAFQRWQLAMRDGTVSEQVGERTRLQLACAHYNVLAGRVAMTTESVA